MPLINTNKNNEEKAALRIRLHKTVSDEIAAYCSWADIKYKDFFIEQACSFIFNEDKEWLEYKQFKNNNQNPANTPDTQKAR